MRNVKTMPIGEQFTLTEDEVLDVKYIRTLETRPKKNVDSRGEAVVPIPYAQMRYGDVSFTVNTQEDVDILENKDSRDDLYSMTLEATEYSEEAVDLEGNPVLQADGSPVMTTRRGLAFVSLMTYESKIKREVRKVAVTGAVQAEKVKYGLDKNANVADVAAELKALLAKENAESAAEA